MLTSSSFQSLFSWMSPPGQTVSTAWTFYNLTFQSLFSWMSPPGHGRVALPGATIRVSILVLVDEPPRPDIRIRLRRLGFNVSILVLVDEPPRPRSFCRSGHY